MLHIKLTIVVWKSRWKAQDVFFQFWGGRVYRGCKTLSGGYTFLGFYNFYCIFIGKFCENLGGMGYFYPPTSPLPLTAPPPHV